jgi:hypothetical protein
MAQEAAQNPTSRKGKLTLKIYAFIQEEEAET